MWAGAGQVRAGSSRPGYTQHLLGSHSGTKQAWSMEGGPGAHPWGAEQAAPTSRSSDACTGSETQGASRRLGRKPGPRPPGPFEDWTSACTRGGPGMRPRGPGWEGEVGLEPEGRLRGRRGPAERSGPSSPRSCAPRFPQMRSQIAWSYRSQPRTFGSELFGPTSVETFVSTTLRAVC